MGSEKKRSYCCCSCCTAVILIGCLVCFGVLFACLAAGFIPLFNDIFHDTVKKQSVLKDGSDSFNEWQKPSTPMYMKYYVFNYTNVDDILKNHSRPRVEQLGPYSYREYKFNDILNRTEDEISYLGNVTYVFDPETSCPTCTENDTIFTPNTAIITVFSKIKDFNITNPSWLEKKALSLANGVLNADKDVTLFIKLTFYKLMWGYHNNFLDRIGELEYLAKLFGFKLPDINPFVALQYNNTKGAILGGNATIFSGKTDINKVQVYKSWKGMRELPYWRTKYGNMINGTDGTRFHPFMSRDDVLSIFNNQLCRSLHLNYEKDTSVEDISLYKYTTLPSVFANHTTNPDNYAFCGPTTCWGAGLLEVSQCQDGNPPIFISSPHFYQGAQFLVDAIEGMNPKKELHETYLSLEPITGIVMDARKRIQVNINARPSLWFDVMKPLRDENNFLPVMFVEEAGTIQNDKADQFKNLVVVPQTLLKWIPYALFILAGLFIISAFAVGLHAHMSSKKEWNGLYTKFDDDEDDTAQNGYTNDSYVT